MSNAATVQGLYASFGAGDIPAILAKLADDVDWQYGADSTDVPWLQHRSGRDADAGFFESLGAREFSKFEPKQILEGDGVVVALIDVDSTVKATGKRVAEENEVHVWHFNAGGKVSRLKFGLDSHLHQTAYTP